MVVHGRQLVRRSTVFACAWRVCRSVLQSTVKHQLSADEAKAQAAELVRKARIKREREEAELARVREREVGAWGNTARHRLTQTAGDTALHGVPALAITDA